MNKKLYIGEEEYSFEIHETGIRVLNNEEDKFIPNKDIFSLRYISLFKIEFYLYCFVSVIAFGFWWVIGLIMSLYTFAQFIANKKVVLLTTLGQIVFTFNDEFDKKYFLNEFKKTCPESFRIKKWFQFRKEK